MGFADVSNSSGVQDPTWECILDGTPIDVNNPPDSPTDQFSFCSWDTDGQGKHNITLNVKSNGKQLFFDQITYVPDPHIPVRNVTVLVGKEDDALMVHEGVESVGSMKTGSRMAMGGAGPVVTFSFFGTGLSWFGKVKDGLDQPMLSGCYSIDNQQPPINFAVNASSGQGKGSSKSKTPLLFFQAHHLPLVNHTITVTNIGDTQSTHLPLSYLILDNGQLPQPSIRLSQPSPRWTLGHIRWPRIIPNASSVYPSQPSYMGGGDGRASDSGQVSDPKKTFPFQQIVIALAGTLFLVFIAGVILCIRRRRRTRRNRIESLESAMPIAPTPTGSSSTSAPPPYTPPQNIFSNFAKRFTSSTSNRPNSLFQSSRPLSPLPSKRISFASSAGFSARTYRPYISQGGSEPPSRKGSLRFSFPDDQTVVEEQVEYKEGRLWHPKPPEGMDNPPPSDGGG
ncbi:hypothetical protein CPB84DRAFT_1799849 [Gymnopilus junonius]|uniref:Uncharacterized protein n=1 Tax=Gymnopilus junonius TaxID=109634 RepID=A0A9P5TFT0_GYMJU|nr:hypothetical protein CPB84DRAFT_1799849 [Gymnopilus junonius]